jgi:MSHA biogenesis protein MshQ
MKTFFACRMQMIFSLFKSVTCRAWAAKSLLGGVLLAYFVQAQCFVATGQFFTVPIPTNLLNQDITTWSNGSVYSGHMSGGQTFSGVPFAMKTSSTGMNVVWGTSISVFSTSGGTTYTNTVQLNTNLYGATKVYTLINGAWGSTGKTVGSVTFNTLDGQSHTVNLTEGVNVRDHFSGGFVNSVSAPYVTTNVLGSSNSGNARLDMQGFSLPANFSTRVLSSIVFTSKGSDATGLPFLAGVTVDAAYATDHVRLTHTGSGLTCTGSTVTVTACQGADASGSCTPSTLGISGNVVATNTSGTVVTSQPFSIPLGSSSTTVTMSDATAETVNFSVSGLSYTPLASPAYTCWNSAAGSTSCSHTYASAGFIFSNSAGGAAATIPSQVSGTSSSTLYLRAVKAGTTTAACTAALTGPQTVNMAYACNNPTNCYGVNLMSVNGGTATTIQRNNNGSALAYTGVSLTFDANGNAPLTVNYSDVGLVTLHASKLVNSVPLSGSSNSFVVKPYGFAISNIKRTSDAFANPAASSATGNKFIAAGKAFSATVTAVNSVGGTTPNFGRETTPEGVTLTPSLVLPVGGSSGALGGSSSIPGGSFSNGVATVTDLTWSEVGIISLMPSVSDSDYLGAGPVSGTSSGNVGRFYPDHFTTKVTPGCSTSTAFTYSAQPFVVEATAFNASGGVTTNYASSGFAKDVTLSEANGVAGTLVGTVAASAFTLGVGSSATPVFTFTNAQTAPSTIAIRAVDTDSASSLGYSEGTNLIRSGRLLLNNAYGSELLPLAVPTKVQYWTASGWAQNIADSCTKLTVPTLSNTLSAKTSATLASPVAGGDGRLRLSAPGAGNTGLVDISGSVMRAGNTWLTLPVPTARACFGACGPRSPVIYLRESY